MTLRDHTRFVSDAWSSTDFGAPDLNAYGCDVMLEETRRGVAAMSGLALILLFGEALLYMRLELGPEYLYTSALLAVLASNVMLSARAVYEIRALHVLGMSLLVISSTALVLLAHQTGVFSGVLFASITLLFMIVPLVPWGLREALIVNGLIYVAVTASTFSVQSRFDIETLLSLQLVMIGAGVVSLVVVTRNLAVRKSDIQKRFDLEMANDRILVLSNKDPLTGAWNRRFLKHEFLRKRREWRDKGRTFHFAFLDVDDFKPLNDTYGHDFGDKVLQWTSGTFSELIAGNGFVVRMGGDEFAMFFTHDDPEAMVREGLARVQRCSASEGLADARIGMSVGIVSVDPGIEATQSTVYKRADKALYEAKSAKHRNHEQLNLVRYAWRSRDELQPVSTPA